MNHIIFSFDLELGWGVIENGRWRMMEKKGIYQNLRPTFKQLIDIMDAHEFPATWATVGALIASPNSDEFNYLPVSVRENIRNFLDESENKTKDGRDLFEVLLSSKTSHEIASHTYSHTRFNYEGYDIETKKEDMERSISIIEKWTDRKPQSFVFPQNIASDFELLDKSGIKNIRVTPNKTNENKESILFKTLNEVLWKPPVVINRKICHNLMLHSSSLFFYWGGRIPSVRRYITINQAKRAINRTAQGLGDSHFWVHPFNLTATPKLKEDFFNLIKKISKLRDQGKINIICMSNYLSANHS